MSRKRWLLFVAVFLVLTGCVAFFPCLQTVRDREGWYYSASNLKQIGQALRSYCDVYGQLPPVVKYSKDGRPLFSWRVWLLPFLENQRLFSQFNLEEPWDSPHNKQLLEEIPRCYRLPWGPDDGPGMTHYQVFVGPGTTFEGGGLADTLLVVEAANPVPWTKPADLVYAPDKPLPALGGLFQKPIHLLCYEISRRDGFTGCFGDGSARFIYSDTDERTLRRFIAHNGGENSDK